MTSKINGTDNRSTSAVGAGRAVGRVKDVTAEARTAEQETNAVHITGTARQLVELEQMVKDMPAVDEAKVAAISSAIEQALAPLTGKR